MQVADERLKGMKEQAKLGGREVKFQDPDLTIHEAVEDVAEGWRIAVQVEVEGEIDRFEGS